jgi:hypothetical protein
LAEGLVLDGGLPWPGHRGVERGAADIGEIEDAREPGDAL